MANNENKSTDASSEAQGLHIWEKFNVQLSRLHLDLLNPRHDPAATEAKAIEYLYEPEDVYALASDIAHNRALNPLDIVGVVPMPGNQGHFIVVEGNRRVCALLLLKDPDRAPTPDARRAMAELSNMVTAPAQIEVVRFDSRESAKTWIDLRHLGPQEGQGLKPWSPTQKERATTGGGQYALALAVLDRARDGHWFGREELPAVSTIARYLKNREVRAALGLSHHKQLVFSHKPSEVDTALRQFIQDAMPTRTDDKPEVNSRSKYRDFVNYANGLRARGVSPQTPLPEPIHPTPPSPSNTVPSKERSKRDPYKRQHLVPSDFVIKAQDRNLLALFKEMKRTPIENHEFANIFLLRAFVERVMALYLRKVEPGYQWQKQEDLTQRCAFHLDPKSNIAKFKSLRVAASDKDKAHSLHSLGAAVHSGLLMDRRSLITAWGNWEVALKAMLTEFTNP